MPQLDPTWFASQLFWLAITFTALYVLLAYFILPPLQQVLERRKETVGHDLRMAQTLKSQAETARQEYERALSDARSKAQALMSEAEQGYKSKSEAANKAIDGEIEKKLSEAARKITAKKEELMQELTPTAEELTAMIVEKLTQRKPASTQIKDILSELAKGRS